MYLLQSGRSFPIIDSSCAAIKYFHSICGHTIGNSSTLKHLLEAARRISAHVTKGKHALKIEDIRKIGNYLDKERNLKNLRTKTIILLSFTGFLRYSECQNIKRSDIFLYRDHAKLFIEKSKTDVYREGHWIYLARLNSSFCPVKNLERYLHFCNINTDSNEFIFRPIHTNVNGLQSLRKSEKPIAYSTARDNVLQVIAAIGLNPKDFGLHSLRSGGASAAANLGVKDRLIMKHGRWKTEGVKNRYISEDLDNLLLVSRSIGI